MMELSFCLVIYNNEEVWLFYHCIFRKRMRNLYSMKSTDASSGILAPTAKTFSATDLSAGAPHGDFVVQGLC